MTRAQHPAVNCEGKVRFEDPARARQVAHRQSHNKGLRSNAYRCPHCQGWHVGTTTKPKAAARAPKGTA